MGGDQDQKGMGMRSLPGSLSQVKTIAKYELINYLRTRRFFILLSITVAISILLTSVVAYYRPAGFLSSELGFYSSWWGLAINYILILSAIFFGGDAISGEFQNKTGYFLIGNPISRAAIYAGKLVAALLASLTVFAIFTAFTVGNGFYYFGISVPWQFGLSFLFSILYLVSIMGFTFFFSSAFKSSSMSILVTAILFLFAFNLIQTLVSNLVQIEPWFLITYGAQIIGNILNDPYPPHIAEIRVGPNMTFTSYNATVPEGVAIMAIYFAATIALGFWAFKRKELT